MDSIKLTSRLITLQADAFYIIKSAVAKNDGVIYFNADHGNIPSLYMNTIFNDNEICAPLKIQNGCLFYKRINYPESDIENIPFSELGIHQLCEITDYIEYHKWDTLTQKVSTE